MGTRHARPKRGTGKFAPERGDIASVATGAALTGGDIWGGAISGAVTWAAIGGGTGAGAAGIQAYGSGQKLFTGQPRVKNPSTLEPVHSRYSDGTAVIGIQQPKDSETHLPTKALWVLIQIFEGILSIKGYINCELSTGMVRFFGM